MNIFADDVFLFRFFMVCSISVFSLFTSNFLPENFRLLATVQGRRTEFSKFNIIQVKVVGFHSRIQ